MRTFRIISLPNGMGPSQPFAFPWASEVLSDSVVERTGVIPAPGEWLPEVDRDQTPYLCVSQDDLLMMFAGERKWQAWWKFSGAYISDPGNPDEGRDPVISGFSFDDGADGIPQFELPDSVNEQMLPHFYQPRRVNQELLPLTRDGEPVGFLEFNKQLRLTGKLIGDVSLAPFQDADYSGLYGYDIPTFWYNATHQLYFIRPVWRVELGTSAKLSVGPEPSSIDFPVSVTKMSEMQFQGYTFDVWFAIAEESGINVVAAEAAYKTQALDSYFQYRKANDTEPVYNRNTGATVITPVPLFIS